MVGLADMAFPVDNKGRCAAFISRETTSSASILLGKHDLLRLGLRLDWTWTPTLSDDQQG